MQQLTTDSTPDWRAQFSPDGRSIGFYSYRSGSRDLWVMPADGGRARQVTNNHAENYFGDWSPDGKNIVFWSNQSGADQLWVVAAEGGTPRRLTDRAALDAYPTWSRDGSSIAFASTVGNMSTIWRIPANGGTPIQLTKEFSWAPQWSPDSKWIYFTTLGPPLRKRGGGNIWAVSADGAIERQMTDLGGRRGRIMTTALATDGQHLFFSWGEPAGHIWVMDVRKNDR
jgi:TolB protein